MAGRTDLEGPAPRAPREARRRPASLVFALGILLALELPPAPSASAGSASIRLSRAVGPPTTPTTVRGRGFGPAEAVTITFDAEVVGTSTTDGQGRFANRVRVPASGLPGLHTIVATGEDSGESASAPFTVRTDWTKFHFDLWNTGENPFENVLDPTNVGGLVPDWSRKFDTFSGVTSSPAVVSGVLYVGVSDVGPGQADLVALDAGTGEIVWRQRIDGTGIADPTVATGRVFVGTLTDHTLHAYEARTGTPLWSFTGPGGMGTPIVAGGVLYVRANTGVLFALDPETGEEIWQSWAARAMLGEAPAIAGGRIYLGSDDHRLYAFDQATGIVLWTAPTNNAIVMSPAVSDRTVFVTSNDDTVYAFDAVTGALRWSTQADGKSIQSSPTVADGLVYVGAGDAVYALEAETGVIAWSTLVQDQVSTSTASVAAGVVYIGSNDGRLFALDARTGVVLWTWSLPGDMGDPPAVADGRVYIGTQSDGFAYAFHLPVGA